MPKVKLVDLVSGLTSRLKQRVSVRKQRAPQQLGDMPVDVIMEVFLHLDCADVLCLAQVSRLFYDLSQSLAVWKNLAFKLMCRGRRISLHDHLSTSSLTVAQLRQSVLMTVAAEEAWLGATPMHVTVPHPVRLDDVDLDHASYIMKFTSRRHLVLPTKAGELIGWDTRTSTCAGKYDMGADFVLINVQGDYSTRSLYWITGKISSDPEHEQNLHIKILRIQFPEPSSSHPVAFDVLGELVTPWCLAAELHFLDASQRMICAVFLNEETCTAGLHVVLDWNTGLSYMFDTGTTYEYGRAVIGLHLSVDKQFIILRSEHCGKEVRRAYSLKEMQSRAFIWDAVRRPAHSLPLVQPAALALFLWEHENPAFDFSMEPHTVWVLPQWWPTYPGVPRRTSTIILYLSFVYGPMGESRRIWRAAQHYSDAVESAPEGGGEVYEKYDILGCEGGMTGGAPCSAVRSVVDIGGDAVTISLGLHGLPILAQSFNHLGWIEEYVEEEDDGSAGNGRYFGLGRLRARSLLSSARRHVSILNRSSSASSSSSSSSPRRIRTLKLVTFPDPGESPHLRAGCKLSNNKNNNAKPSRRPVPWVSAWARYGKGKRECACTTLRPVTLDVPAAVLDAVYHMFIDPAAGTVTLATEDNELHVYQYGRPVPPVPSAPGPSSEPSSSPGCGPGHRPGPVVSV